MTYHLFAGDNFFKADGMSAYLGPYTSIEEASNMVESSHKQYEWYQVVIVDEENWLKIILEKYYEGGWIITVEDT